MTRLARSGLLLWLSLALAAQTAPVERASVFAREGDATQPLFTFERTMATTNGQNVANVRFRDRAGAIAVTERVTYAGQSVVRHELVQHQIDKRYVMTVSGDGAVFEIERNGETSRTRHNWTPDTLTVDQIRPHVTAHWNQLMRGEEISFRLVALTRARIVSFTLKRHQTTERGGRPWSSACGPAVSWFDGSHRKSTWSSRMRDGHCSKAGGLSQSRSSWATDGSTSTDAWCGTAANRVRPFPSWRPPPAL